MKMGKMERKGASRLRSFKMLPGIHRQKRKRALLERQKRTTERSMDEQQRELLGEPVSPPKAKETRSHVVWDRSAEEAPLTRTWFAKHSSTDLA